MALRLLIFTHMRTPKLAVVVIAFTTLPTLAVAGSACELDPGTGTMATNHQTFGFGPSTRCDKNYASHASGNPNYPATVTEASRVERDSLQSHQAAGKAAPDVSIDDEDSYPSD